MKKGFIATSLLMVLMGFTSLYSLTALQTVIAVEAGDSVEAIPLFKDVATSATAISPTVVAQPLHGTVTTVAGKTVYWRNQRPATNSFKSVPVTWFKYKPSGNFTGTDSFTYNVSDGNGVTSNTVTCIVKVRPVTRSGQTIIFVVNNDIAATLATEINRLKSDLESDGYSVIQKNYVNPSPSSNITGNPTGAKAAWDTIRAEYLKPQNMICGAILFGYVPAASVLGIASDDAYWNMSVHETDWAADSMYFHLGDDPLSKNDTTYGGYGAGNYMKGGSLRHIWVSRFYALSTSGRTPSPYGSEIKLMKMMLDNNHDYRTGTSRYPHRVNFYDMARLNTTFSMSRFTAIWQDTFKIPNASTSGRVILQSGDTINKTLTPYVPGEGGEVWDINSHGNTTFLNPTNLWAYARTDTLMKRPFQTRFVFLSACHTSLPGNFTNNHLFTRGGGAVLSVGTSDYVRFPGWFSIANSQTVSATFTQKLVAGSSFGNAWLASDMPLGKMFFYGDLSLRPKMTPANQFPVVSRLEKSTPSSGTTRLEATASDPDGSITAYEWWFATAYDNGQGEPDTVTTVPYIEVSSSRVTAPVRLEAIDNYKARFTVLLEGDVFTGYVTAEQEIPSLSENSKNAISVFPNPFNPSVGISVNVPAEAKGAVTLAVYDLNGRLVKKLVDNSASKVFRTNWDGSNSKGNSVPAGVYLVNLEAGKFKSTATVVFAK